MAAPLLCPPSSSLAAEAELKVLGRWQTDNVKIRPFALDGSIVYLSGDKTVEAWNIDSGERIWSQPLAVDTSFTPRIAGDFLVTSGRTILTVRDRNTGEEIWSRAPKAEDKDDPRGHFGAPYYNDGRLYFGEASELITVDIATGKELWTFSSTGGFVGYPPIAWKDLILVGTGDGPLRALDAVTGKELWNADRSSEWQYLRQLHISGDILVAGGYKDNLIGVDLTDGRIMWDHYSGNFINSHMVVGNLAYFFSARGWVFALDVKTGYKTWKHQTRDWKGRSAKGGNWSMVMAEIVSDGKDLYIMDMSDVLRVLDAKTGDKLATYKMPGKMRYFITLVPDSKKMLFATNKGEILLTERPQ